MEYRASAASWLKTYMAERAGQDVPSRQIRADAEAAGYKWATIQEARKRMRTIGIRYSHTFPQSTSWVLKADQAEGDLEPRVATLERDLALWSNWAKARLVTLEERLAALEIQSIS